MKNIILTAIAVLLTSVSFAQTTNVEEARESANPYPVVTDQPVSDKAALFINSFNKERNVGNLHVYSFIDQPAADYYFTGREFAPGLSDMYSADLRRKNRKQNAKVYAVQSIRGEGEEYYIIREPGMSGNNRLSMYELNDDKLTFKINLADAKKVGNKVKQTDSWIADIDGDVLLDVIRVNTKMNANGKVLRKKVTVFFQQQDGTFKAKPYSLDPYLYAPENLMKK